MQGLRPDAGAVCGADRDPHPSRHRCHAAFGGDRVRSFDARQCDRAAGSQELCRTQTRARRQARQAFISDQGRHESVARHHAVGRSRAGADFAAAQARRPQDAADAARTARRPQQRGLARAAARRRCAGTFRQGELMAGAGTQPVLIAGGGIGGLATALGLAQKGIRSILLEKASALGEIGAGIQLGPNAFHAFDYLGVGEAARGMAVYVDRMRLMDALTAEEITHVDLGEAFRARFGNPYAVVHRGDLHGVFLKACQAHGLIELRVSSEVVGYDQDGSSVTAKLASGDRVTGSLLIGADGLWSNVRKQVVGDGKPRVSGHTTYRSVIPTDQMPEDLRWNGAALGAGVKCHLVHSPLSGWKVFNLVVTCHNDAPEPVAGKPVPEEEVMRGFAHIHERALDIIRHGTNWKLWGLCDRDPTERWIDGRVVLLGDAPHPMR